MIKIIFKKFYNLNAILMDDLRFKNLLFIPDWRVSQLKKFLEINY